MREERESSERERGRERERAVREERESSERESSERERGREREINPLYSPVGSCLVFW